MLAGAFAAAVGPEQGGVWFGLLCGGRRTAGRARAGQHEPPVVGRPVRRRAGAQRPRARHRRLPGRTNEPKSQRRQARSRSRCSRRSRSLGPALFDQPWVLYLVYPIIPVIWYLLYRTRWGLEVRAVGEDPNASDVSGLRVNKLRRQTIYLTGMLAGIGGGYFLYARSGRFEDSLIGGAATSPSPRSSSVGGRSREPSPVAWPSGSWDRSCSPSRHSATRAIDPAFLAMAPSVVTIVAMTIFATRVRQPAALARPFIRGLK